MRLEEKGFLFLDDRAWNDVENEKEMFPNLIPVWDSKKSRTVNRNQIGTAYSTCYYDGIREVFVPSWLSYIVLGHPDFFNSKPTDIPLS